MSPIILLRDESKSYCLEDKLIEKLQPKTLTPKSKRNKQESTLNDFLQYAESLLSSSNQQLSPSQMGLLSPSLSLSRRSSFVLPEEATSKQAIDTAVLSSLGRKGSSQMFEIARNGQKVASLSLARPAYKLGEVVIAVIDFTNAQIPCYHVSLVMLLIAPLFLLFFRFLILCMKRLQHFIYNGYHTPSTNANFSFSRHFIDSRYTRDPRNCQSGTSPPLPIIHQPCHSKDTRHTYRVNVICKTSNIYTNNSYIRHT